MILIAWTAAYVIAILTFCIILIGILTFLIWQLPEGRTRSACQLILALLGLAITTLMARI